MEVRKRKFVNKNKKKMVMDNRSPGFTEVNSFRKKTQGIVPSIRQYLQEVNKTDNTNEDLLEISKTQSTTSYVRTAREGTNHLKLQEAIIITDTKDLSMDISGEQSFVSADNRTEVKIKQEMIDSGIVGSPFQMNEMGEASTEAELSEDTNDDKETSDTMECSDEEDGTQKQCGAPTNTNRRSWGAAGSRKKLKQYYAGVSRFQKTVVFADEQVTKDSSTKEAEITAGLGKPVSSEDFEDITEDIMDSEETLPTQREEFFDESNDNQGFREARNQASGISFASTLLPSAPPADSNGTDHTSDGNSCKSVSTGTGHFTSGKHSSRQLAKSDNVPDDVAGAERQTTVSGPSPDAPVTAGKSDSSSKDGKNKDSSLQFGMVGQPAAHLSPSFPPSSLRNRSSKTPVAQPNTQDTANMVTGTRKSFHGFDSPKNYTPQMPRTDGYNFTFDRRRASGLKVIAKSTESVKDKMAYRGRYMVEQDLVLVTSIKVEFNLSALTTEYNVRAQFIHLLELFKQQDSTIRVQCSTSEVREWKDFSTLPEDEEFNECFQLVTKIFRKHKKVIVHCTILTEQPLNRVKYSSEVKDYIFQNNIWIKVDRYDSKEESSPGFFVMIHPKLINREDFTVSVVRALKKVKEDQMDLSSDMKDNVQFSKSKDVTGVPEFHLELSQKKWGKLRTEVIRINCALDDADELKSMLSMISERNLLPTGIFVPVGIHLLSGPEVMTQLLTEHVKYINNVRGIPITGISIANMDSLQDNDLPTVREQLLAIKSVISVERTRETSYSGKWIVLTTLETEDAVLKTVTMALQAMQHSKMICSHTLVTVGRRSLRSSDRATTAVHSYADALTKQFAVPTNQMKHPATGETKAKAHQSSSRKTLPTNPAANLPRKSTQAVTGREPSKDEKNLQNRFAAIEKKWQTLEDRLALKQEAQVNTLINKLADKLHEDHRNERDRWSQTFETKFEDYKQGTDAKLTLVNDSLGDMVDKHLENKFDTISMKVAEHVTIQLMKLLRPSTGQSPLVATQWSEMVTQDGATTPNRRPGSEIDTPGTYVQNLKPAAPPTEKKLNESNNDSPPTCSPHDTTFEHMLDDN